MIDAYRRGYGAGYTVARELKANILLTREELEPIARSIISQLVEKNYAYLEPIEDAVTGCTDGWYAWLFSYIPRDTLEAALSWGEPVSS